MNCPLSGSCEFANICEAGDVSLVSEAVINSPEMQIMAPELDQEHLEILVKPVMEAWLTEPCLKEKVRSLKELQFRENVPHVSITMAHSVLDKVDEVLGVS